MHSLWMIAASVLFACMGVCVKLGSTQFSAAELVFWRGFIATLIIGAYVGVRRLPLKTPHVLAHGIRGISGTVSLVMYFYAISLIPLATAVTLNYTSPLFLALLLIGWVGEGAGRRVYLALLSGFLGVVLLLQPTWHQDQWLGGLLGLGSGVFSSVAYYNVRRLGELGEPEWRTVFYFSAMSAIVGIPWALATLGTQTIGQADIAGWLAVTGVGTFGTLAQLCMTAAYRRGRTLTTAVFAYSTVIFSSLFGMLLWRELLPPAAWGGVLLIVGSGLVVSWKTQAASSRAGE